MTIHPVQWQSPSPLWSRLAAAERSRPAVLRFTTDDFMDDLMALLARDPAAIGDWLARPETWRSGLPAEPPRPPRVALPRKMIGAVLGRAGKAEKQVLAPVQRDEQRQQAGQTVSLPLKLFQPAHQRFYLVTASLVCGIPGLPDRAVQAGGPAEVGFVVRRLLPSTPNDTAIREFALLKGAGAPRWQRLAPGQTGELAAGEEMLPMFALRHHGPGDLCRAMWTGFIPVARREDYLGATVSRSDVTALDAQIAALGATESAAPASKSARMMHFRFHVAEPWKALIAGVHTTCQQLTATANAGLAAAVRAVNLQWQMQSWLILLDFADYLAEHMPDLWAVITGAGDAGALPPARRDLHATLAGCSMSTGLADALVLPGGVARPAATTLLAALRAVRSDAVRQGLEQTDLTYSTGTAGNAAWPPFHFLLAGITTSLTPDGPYKAFGALAAADANELPPEPQRGSTLPPGQLAAETLDRLTAAVVRALDSQAEPTAPPLSFALQLRDTLRATAGDPGWFVIRCVYLNPECGPLHPPVLSAPTEPFQLANFFDPDAPARPVRITLPADTSAAGLRKHSKNTAFVVSDMLCGQIQRAKGMGLIDLVRAVLPFPFHKDLESDGGSCNSGGVNIGMICSLSIPIITICALILLIIIVSLLDLIFFWRPFFMMCLPVPGLRGKK